MENERNVSPVSAHGFNNEKPPCESRVVQSVEKAIFYFYASCGSTHSIEFALQIHKFREHVSRNLYKGRKNVSAGRGFSSRFARKRGFERVAVRKTKFFDSLTTLRKQGGFVIPWNNKLQ